jgi:hypothetical protein
MTRPTTTTRGRARLLEPLLPYAATVVGLHGLHNAWTAVLLYHAGIVVVLAFRARRVSPSGSRRRWPPLATLTVWLSAASGVFLYLLWEKARVDGLVMTRALSDLGLDGASWWLFVVYFSVVHPPLEERYWRPVEDTRVRKGLTWKDLAFAGYHAIPLLFFLKAPFVIVACAGIVVGAALWRRLAAAGAPSAAVASHAIGDISVMMAAAALRLGS